MDRGTVKWLPRGRRRRWLLLLVLLLAGGGAWYWWTRPADILPYIRRGKPPVGAYSFRDHGGGEADFAMQTQDGRFNIRSGSREFRDMPYDFPFYPGARLSGSANVNTGDPATSGRYVHFTTADPPEKVVGFYRRQAEAALLKIVTDQDIDGIAVLTGLYPDGRDGGFQLTVRRAAKGETDGMLSSGFGQDVTFVPQPDPELANITVPSVPDPLPDAP